MTLFFVANLDLFKNYFKQFGLFRLKIYACSAESKRRIFLQKFTSKKVKIFPISPLLTKIPTPMKMYLFYQGMLFDNRIYSLLSFPFWQTFDDAEISGVDWGILPGVTILKNFHRISHATKSQKVLKVPLEIKKL